MPTHLPALRRVLLVAAIALAAIAPVPASAAFPPPTTVRVTLDSVAPPESAPSPVEVSAPDDLNLNSWRLDGHTWMQVPYDGKLWPKNALTIEAWVRPATGSGWQTILGHTLHTGSWFGFNTALRFYSEKSHSYVEGVTSLPRDAWTHVAVSWASGGQTLLYINGEVDATRSAGPPAGAAADLLIGSDYDGTLAMVSDLAEVRIWEVVRSQNDIRRDMHVQLDEPLPGLVANWHLTGDYLDAIGGFHGTPHGSSFTGEESPARPALPLIEPEFGQLPSKMQGATVTALGPGAAAVFSGENPALRTIYSLDLTSGAATPIGEALPGPAYAGAAYADVNGTAYFFGGRDATASDFSDEVAAATPAGITKLPQLAQPMESGPVVYHPVLKRIFLFGGWLGGATYSDGILEFDPLNPAAPSPRDLTTPTPLYAVPGVYSSLTGKIYIFGAFDGATLSRNIFEFTLSADGWGDGGVVVPGVVLPDTYSPYAAAAEDPVTGIIYLASNSRILAFDPLSRELWSSPPLLDFDGKGGMVYHTATRSLVVAGGASGDISLDKVVRIRQGSGPRMPQGRWDFPAPTDGAPNAIAGAGPVVLIGTQTGSLYAHRSDGSVDNWTGAELGATTVRDVRYATPENDIWAATDAGAIRIRPESTAYFFDATEDIRAIELEPDYPDSSIGFFLGAAPDEPGGLGGIQWRDNAEPYAWRANFGDRTINALTHRAEGDLWGAAASNTIVQLQYTRSPGGSTATETLRGVMCPQLTEVTDLEFDPQGDLWLVSPTGAPVRAVAASGPTPPPVAPASPGQGVCLVRNPATAPVANYYPATEVGSAARKATVDGDGRVWVGVESQRDESGGLAAYENRPDGLSTGGFNWLNAPLGIGTPVLNSNPGVNPNRWNSGVSAAGAVDERIWTGNVGGRLVTYAPRWFQVDRLNGLQNWAFTGVWTLRGRLFAQAANAEALRLWVLAPDGRTWAYVDTPGDPVTAMVADRRGRIWAGRGSGLYFYQGGTLIQASGFAGEAPQQITSLAQTPDGRIWIGSSAGLTLFDRERFVLTFTAMNSPLPGTQVNALWADSAGDLWVAMDGGLARLRNDELLDMAGEMGVPAGPVLDVAVTANKVVAISTPAGVWLTGVTGAFALASEDYLHRPLPLAIDENDNLRAGGAVRRGGSWALYYSTNSGLRHSAVADLAVDGAGSLWFAHSPATGLSVRSSYLPPLGATLPTISGVNPRQGSRGAQVTITGSGFSANPADLEVTIGGVPVPIVRSSSASIVVTVGPEVVSGDVTVRARGQAVTFGSTGSGGSLQRAFCAIAGYETFAPTGGNFGVPVEVTGYNMDPGAMWVQIGNGAYRLADASTPTRLRTMIRPPGDVTSPGSERINIQRRLTGCADTTMWLSGFRVYQIGITEVFAYQGISSDPLIADRPTLVAAYPVPEGSLMRPGDLGQVDAAVITWTTDDARSVSEEVRLFRSFPFSQGDAGDPLLREDLTRWITVTNVLPTLPNWNGGNLRLDVTLKRSGFDVATAHETFSFNRNVHLPVLLVPIMRSDSTERDFNAVVDRLYAGREDFHKRMLPNGDLDIQWSQTIINIDNQTPMNLANYYFLYIYGRRMDRIRSFISSRDTTSQDPIVAFGLVQKDAATGAQGVAFWPDTSSQLNDLLVGPLAAACRVLTAPLNLLGLGLEEDCDLEIPLYVGWGHANDNIPVTMVHELGHVLGLVSPWAVNSDRIENMSHSYYDELAYGSCNTSDAYDTSRTLYSAPGVIEPVINPITGWQYFPNLNRAVDGSYKDFPRGKSMMSYACADGPRNTFFEPADVSGSQSVYAMMGLSPIPSSSPAAASGEATQNVSPAAGEQLPQAPLSSSAPNGGRVRVTGEVDRVRETGQLVSVDALGEESRISPSYNTGYWLVQLDIDGHELARTGVYPQFNIAEQDGGLQELDTAFFAATIAQAVGLARLELRYDDKVLDYRRVGKDGPTVDGVSVELPPEGAFGAEDTIPITYNARHPSGDPLGLTFYYSRDGGASWVLAGMSDVNSGAFDLRALTLGGSENARIKVVASDGFHQAEAVSEEKFKVLNRPPRVYISTPLPGETGIEGQPVWLEGSAMDWQDVSIEGSTGQLRWSSDRDGVLGTGDRLPVGLSVGEHRITLEATNSAGLTGSATVVFNVSGDYDYDGVSDHRELGNGLNPLQSADAYSDNDKDGLAWQTENNRGTNPDDADSDDDTFSDRAEIEARTDPLNHDDNPDKRAPDALIVSPGEIVIEADLALDLAMPLRQLVITSDTPAAWSATADVPWIGATSSAGKTPSTLTVQIATWQLSEGEHLGTIHFTSPSLPPVDVPVTVRISNRARYCDVSLDGATTRDDLALVESKVGLSAGQAGYEYRADLDRNASINGEDVALEQECFQAAATPSVGIRIAGTDVELSWTDDARNMGGYRVWYSPSPYFAPGPSTLHEDLPAGHTVWRHQGAAGGPAHSWYYAVEGLNGGLEPSEPSNRKGFSSFSLVKGAP